MSSDLNLIKLLTTILGCNSQNLGLYLHTVSYPKLPTRHLLLVIEAEASVSFTVEPVFYSVLALQKKRRANKGKNKKPPVTAKDEKRKER